MVKATLTPQALGVPRAPRSTPATVAANTSTKPYVVPFTIQVDTREGAPYGFLNLHANSDRNYRPLVVQVVRQCLQTGDYSLYGHSDRITIERKSLADLMGSLAGEGGERRRRFKEEHERMYCEYIAFGRPAHVVIEATRADVRAYRDNLQFAAPGQAIGAHPNAVLSTSIRWPRRYGVHWHFAGSRDEAERLVFDLLAHEWELIEGEKRDAERAARQAKIAALKGAAR